MCLFDSNIFSFAYDWPSAFQFPTFFQVRKVVLFFLIPYLYLFYRLAVDIALFMCVCVKIPHNNKSYRIFKWIKKRSETGKEWLWVNEWKYSLDEVNQDKTNIYWTTGFALCGLVTLSNFLAFGISYEQKKLIDSLCRLYQSPIVQCAISACMRSAVKFIEIHNWVGYSWDLIK